MLATATLPDLLEDGDSPPPARVLELLRQGADAFAVSSSGRSVLELLMGRVPQNDVMAAWLASAGDLSKEPWGAPERHPLREVVLRGPVSQPDGFVARMVRNLMGAGAPLESALFPPPTLAIIQEHSSFLLAEIKRNMHPAFALPLIDEIIRAHPEFLAQPSMRAFLQDEDSPCSPIRELVAGWRADGLPVPEPHRIVLQFGKPKP